MLRNRWYLPYRLIVWYSRTLARAIQSGVIPWELTDAIRDRYETRGRA